MTVRLDHEFTVPVPAEQAWPVLLDVERIGPCMPGATITKVEVSTDSGRTWVDAPLVAPVLPRALTRFRLPWKWDGTAAVLKSRATDDTGAVQPEREKFIAEHGNNAIFHFHGIQAWSVAANGEVKHVYA